MSSHQPHRNMADDHVSWSQLIAYGMGGLIPIALFNIAGQLMGLLGNIALGLSAFWLGAIMIVPRLWDAFSDPIMGHLSDNTRTRWGRRRPYILFGGVVVAVSFVAMWWVPRGEFVRELFASDAAYNWFQLAYILAGLLIFYTATTVFEIPHGALGMEMSGDYHERTRLFSAKSFFGNLFAMGTPWLIMLAGLELFRGPEGDVADGMRYVSLFIASLLIPLACWWFVSLKEPRFMVARQQQRTRLWHDLRVTASNSTFLRLVAIIFALATGFNFVALFNYYITIFYLYGGDVFDAGLLLGINGTVWAVTGLLAVFPLNWISRRLGKNRTLLIAIMLMCAAQLAKIVCYNPTYPYLLLIPTVLLSAGMLMFFTLGSSMVGDISDEDEFHTGTRSEGSYYSVYWWFIKLGMAVASFVTGALLVLTSFDERQNVTVDALRGNVAAIKSEAERWMAEETITEQRIDTLTEQSTQMLNHLDTLHQHLTERMERHLVLIDNDGGQRRMRQYLSEWFTRPRHQVEHIRRLMEHIEAFRTAVVDWRTREASLVAAPAELIESSDELLEKTALLKQQSPMTLFRLRLMEIGVPLVLCLVSIGLTLQYPLTEQRCYEIKAALKRRHEEMVGRAI